MEHFQTVISQTGMRNFSTLGDDGPSGQDCKDSGWPQPTLALLSDS
jgi:hypothetical protein